MRPPSDTVLAGMTASQAYSELERVVHHYIQPLTHTACQHARTAPLENDDYDFVTDTIQYDVENLRSYLDEIEEALMERRRRFAHDNKIRALRETNGRTAAEIENGRQLADRLEAKGAAS